MLLPDDGVETTQPAIVDLGAVDLPESDTVAAVDLGSNSFHMVIARVLGGHLRVVDRLREAVQLAAGLDERNQLARAAQTRALACLARFGERLRGMPAGRVRAVGTNTLRRAKNAPDFLERAVAALGHPIEVVSGHEEARLIYLGVSHHLTVDASRRLVVDIGGGSTELILGEQFEALQGESLHMGCVEFTRRFFAGGAITREGFRRGEIAARLELQTIERRFRALGWDAAVGSSGTILAVGEVLRAQGWTRGPITPGGLRKLRKTLCAAGDVKGLALAGLKPERAAVLPGGLAILLAVCESLDVDRIHPSPGAMREGLLYDLLGRIQHEDVRDRTIRQFEERYHVAREQAGSVERTARALLLQAERGWRLEPLVARPLLSWAARLHEVGLAISYSSHHKHGAYIVSHSDMPGFSIDGRRVLAALIRGHRRKLQRSFFPPLLGLSEESLLRLCLLLRLAVLLNRSRNPAAVPRILVEARKGALELTFPRGWLEDNPLTRADLEAEATTFSRMGYRLRLDEAGPKAFRDLEASESGESGEGPLE